MKRYLFVLISLIFCTQTFASDGVNIEKVVTFSNKSKTSISVHYEGSDRIQFFTVDSTPGLLILDFPGVTSKFDFSSLSFAQVTEVVQAPLNPDTHDGISVRFSLAEGVRYDVFDHGLGELTLFFESFELPKSPVVSTKPLSKDDSPLQEHSFVGRPGEKFLSEVDVHVQALGGRIFFHADRDVNYRSFFLTNPDRFVLDLSDTILSLDKDDLDLGSSLVKGMRIRQFKGGDAPVVRMVLDLNKVVHVQLVQEPKGLALAFADQPSRLAAILAGEEVQVAKQELPAVEEKQEQAPVQIQNQIGVDAMAAAIASSGLADNFDEATPVPNEKNEVTAVEAPIVENKVVVPVEPIIAESKVVVQEELVAEPVVESKVAVQEEPVAEPVVESKVAVQEEPLTEEPIVESTAAVQETVSTVDSVEEPMVETAAVKTESVVAIADVEKDSELVVIQPSVTSVSVTDAQDVVTEKAVVETEPAVEVPQEELIVAQPVIEPVKNVVAAEPPVVTTEVPAPSKSNHQDIDAALTAFETSSEVVTHNEPQVEAVPEYTTFNVSSPEKTEDAASLTPSDINFEMANELDEEINDFLNEDSDKSIYSMMKNVPSNHRKLPSRVVVTNAAIAQNKELVSNFASYQDEEEGEDSEDFAALFEDAAIAGTSETLASGERTYRGFEISVIDVKDADVVDLLRFIADQVGINLYVDSSVGRLKATYKFRNIPWDQALDIILANANLDKEFRNGVLRVATTKKFQEEEEARASLIEQRMNSVPLDTVTFSLSYANAKAVSQIIETYLSFRGSILVDERTNMLIIEEIPTRMTSIRALIKNLDRMIAQVTIEARVVETTKRFLKELGVQWGLSAQYMPEMGTDTGLRFPNRVGLGGPGGNTVSNGLLGGYAVNFPVVSENPSGIGLSLGNFLDNFKLDISLAMMESDGSGQIISSPKVTTQNNKTAVIRNGSLIPIQTITRGTITVRYVDAVLELKVTPQITSDETVILDVIVDKSEPDFSRSVNGNPVINVRKAETKVLVKNGGTAVIGGIFTLNEQSSTEGIPGLRKIPIVKRLFSHESQQYENQELLIFITPRIVKY